MKNDKVVMYEPSYIDYLMLMIDLSNENMSTQHIRPAKVERVCYPFFRADISNSWGGSFESTYILADELSERYEVSVVLSGMGRPHERAQRYNFPIDTIPFSVAGSINLQNWHSLIRKPILAAHLIPHSPRIISHIQSHDIDIIHTNDPITSLLWGICAKLTDTQLVTHVRGEYISEWKIKATSYLSDHLVFVSESGYTHHRDTILPGTEASVVHNGVDIDRFSPDNAGELRDELDIQAEVPLFGFVGNLVPRKRPLLFVEAAIEYLRNNIGHFVLIGKDSTDMSSQIHKRISEAEVEDHVTLLGFRNDIENIMTSISALVLTSRPSGEAFPRTPLEAMASGTPVIVTDSAGVSEAVIDHTTGIILEPNPSADKISLSLKKLIKDKSTLDEYSSSARKHVCKNFSPHIISGQIESLYNSL